MYDLKIATVRPNRHRPALVGTVNCGASIAKTAQDRRRRVAKAVPANADHRDTRPNGIQQGRRGAARRAMVPDLQQFHGAQGGEEQGFHRPSGIAGEERVEIFEPQMKNQGVFVRRDLTGHPPGRGVQDRKGDRVDQQRIAGPRSTPILNERVDGTQILAVERGPQRLSRLEHHGGTRALDDSRESTEVIRIPV